MTISPLLRWKSLKKQIKSDQMDIRIKICASFTADHLTPHLGINLIENGYAHPHISFAPFNQIENSLRDPETLTYDVACVLWRTEDLVDNPFDTPELFEHSFAELLEAIRTFSASYKGTLVISCPPLPFLPDLTNADITAWRSMHRDIFSALSAIPSSIILDLDRLIMENGLDNSFDRRNALLYRQPWTDKFWDMVAHDMTRQILKSRKAARKCLVLDADNTLWGGIIGEDGIGGIRLGDEFPGLAFRNFQKMVKRLSQRGILLALASKNNPDDVLEVLRKHDAMILKEPDFSAIEIGWEAKSRMIENIARKLNIGTDSLVFIDDQDMELAEVKAAHPDIVTLRVPDELSDLPYILDRSGLFDSAALTDEDKSRAAMMATEQQRETFREKMNEEDFKASLGLEMTVFESQEQHISRIAQLINKTNQFNLTTVRRTESEVRAISHSTGYRVLGMILCDRFGDYGLVGVAILHHKGPDMEIDTLLMSCRALGRGAETAFLSAIAKIAAEAGSEKLIGRYIPTPKNGQTEDFYSKHGFEYDADKNSWTGAPDKIRALLHPVKVTFN